MADTQLPIVEHRQASLQARRAGVNVSTLRGKRDSVRAKDQVDGQHGNAQECAMKSEELRHRLVAILAADAVGYSRLMSHDDHGTVRAIDAARRVFAEQTALSGGRVVDTAGDSVLSVFDTAGGAVAAAMAIQTQFAASQSNVAEGARMRFRIGLHLGDVIEKADGTVYGNGVNIAARLQTLASPGGIALSDAVRTAVAGKVDAIFHDQGEQTIKNIDEPVRMFNLLLNHLHEPSPNSNSEKTDIPPIAPTLPNIPSVAVLAFTNMSGDPDQEYFTDGITEDIITELSRFDSLFVIARNSSFSYKGTAVNVKQIGQELGVRYVVEGSIRRANNRIRVTAQLIDALSGTHVWADRYDRDLEDIFAVQEDVTQCIVAAIAPQVDAAEVLRTRRRPTDVGAYEIATRAAGMLLEGYKGSNRELCERGLLLAQAAVAIDPGSNLALLAIAFANFQNVAMRLVKDRLSAWKAGIDAADRALSINDSATGHAIKASLISHSPTGGHWEEARVEGEMAYRINPQDTVAIGIYAMTLSHTGDATQAIHLLQRSMRINPRNPLAYDTYFELAQAYMFARDYREGLEWANRARASAPRLALPHMLIAALEVALGNIEKAHHALDMARQLAPELIAKRLQKKSDAGQPEFRRRYDTFLRVAAGVALPEEADFLR